jgi:hypothetical protein
MIQVQHHLIHFRMCLVATKPCLFSSKPISIITAWMEARTTWLPLLGNGRCCLLQCINGAAPVHRALSLGSHHQLIVLVGLALLAAGSSGYDACRPWRLPACCWVENLSSQRCRKKIKLHLSVDLLDHILHGVDTWKALESSAILLHKLKWKTT